MKPIELAITRIGNSRGIRIPAEILRRHGIGDAVLLQERGDELVLRPKKQAKLSWKETYREMAAVKEDWSDWEVVAEDGLDES